ncbi:PQQ-binding-like beta-propeller repeat protein [Roseisolibacter sp. H3M3-2]|uniref:outer membrane protein assembly factor BamB family protein n=1 Tax=Roseisolibacter sp. H3M3-2 TaxID=3031323 RepID=UPI0023DB252E|nr:PQQ-binding-like beta-propeller repeat protein [Roseisolibacter sp. H3M3-2]MDF1504930.1 PQQ-binding-like beta-propeller repeat protein [Roseisolibacter sp. H3M3-2]
MTLPSAFLDTPISRRDLLRLGVAAGIAPALPRLRDPRAFDFAYFSDTHLGLKDYNFEACRRLVLEIAERVRPALAVNGGDVTDYGWAGEYDAYRRVLEGIPYPVHHIPGNHDVRWAPRGLQIFRERVGAPYRSFDHAGAHFVLLDSTVPLSHYGHYERAQLRWLEQDLRRVGRATPVFLFSHHQMGRPGDPVDNDAMLLAAVEPYNVKLVFTGHGHQDLLWDWAGMTTTMNKGLYQGSYQRVEVDPGAGEVRLSRRTLESPDFRPLAAVPLAAPREKRQVWPSAPLAATPKVDAPALAARWDRALGGAVMSHLLVADGTLYVSAMDGSVQALRAADGAERWRAATGGYCHSSPVLAGGLVVVGSADGAVYAFDARTGARRWRRPTGGPVYASAAVAKGVAAIASGDGHVYGLALATGAERWRFRLADTPSAFAQSRAATDGARFYVGAWDRNVYALDAETGALVWSRPGTERSFAYSPAIGGPAVAHGMVFVPANGNVLHAFDAATGATRWTFTSPGDKVGYSSPTVVGDRLYIGCLGDKGEVRCLSALDGRELWVAATGSTIYDSSPAVADGWVSIGSVDGILWVLDAETGRIAARHPLPPGHFLSSPAAAGGAVYAATFSDRAFGLALPTRG